MFIWMEISLRKLLFGQGWWFDVVGGGREKLVDERDMLQEVDVVGCGEEFVLEVKERKGLRVMLELLVGIGNIDVLKGKRKWDFGYVVVEELVTCLEYRYLGYRFVIENQQFRNDY